MAGMSAASQGRLPERVFYAYQVVQVNGGAGADSILANGGFFKDTVAGGGYPNARFQMTLDQATRKGRMICRAFQSEGEFDCRYTVYGEPYGQGAANPIQALTGKAGTRNKFVEGDTLDYGWRQALKAMNTEKLTGSGQDNDFNGQDVSGDGANV